MTPTTEEPCHFEKLGKKNERKKEREASKLGARVGNGKMALAKKWRMNKERGEQKSVSSLLRDQHLHQRGVDPMRSKG